MAENNPWTEKSWQRPWTTEEMIANASDWSLAGDAGLLLHLQKFSDDLITRSRQTLEKLDSMFESTVDVQIALSNVTNHFMGLHHTQFVESRVYDEDETKICSEENLSKESDIKEVNTEDNIEVMKRVVEKGLQLLDTHFEKIEVSDSETDDESDGSSFILQPKDPYINRPLPHVIGTKEWFENPHFGLQYSESDESLSGESTPRQKNDMSRSRLTVSDSLSDTDSDFDTSSNKQLDSLPTKPIQRIESTGDIFESNSESETDGQKTSKNANSIFAEELAKKLDKVTSNIDSSMIKKDEDVYGKSDNNLNINKPKQSTDLFTDEPPPLDHFIASGSHSENLFDDNDDNIFWNTSNNYNTDIQKHASSTESDNINLFKEDDSTMLSTDSNKDIQQKYESNIEKSVNLFKSKSIFNNDEDNVIDDLFSPVNKLDKSKLQNYLPQKSQTITPLVSEQPPPINENNVKKKKLPGAVSMIGGTDSLLTENIEKILGTHSHSIYEEEKISIINKTNNLSENKDEKIATLNDESKDELYKDEVIKSNPRKKLLSLFDDNDDYNDFDFLGNKNSIFDNSSDNLIDKSIEKKNEQKDFQKQNVDIFDDLISTKKIDQVTSKVDIFSDSFKNEDLFSSLTPSSIFKDSLENAVIPELEPKENTINKKYKINIFDDTCDGDLFSSVITNKNINSSAKEANTTDKIIFDSKNDFKTNIPEYVKKIDLFNDNFDNDLLSTLNSRTNANLTDKKNISDNIDGSVIENQNKINIFTAENLNNDPLKNNQHDAFEKKVKSEDTLQQNINDTVDLTKSSNISSDIFSDTPCIFTNSKSIEESFKDIEQSYKSHTYNIFDNEPPELDLLDKNDDVRSEIDSTDLFDSELNKSYFESKHITMFEETPPPLIDTEEAEVSTKINLTSGNDDFVILKQTMEYSPNKNSQQSLFSDLDRPFSEVDNSTVFKSAVKSEEDLFQNVINNTSNEINKSVNETSIFDDSDEYRNNSTSSKLSNDKLNREESKDMTSSEDKLSKGNPFNQYVEHYDTVEDKTKTNKKAFIENNTKLINNISKLNNTFYKDMAENEEIDSEVISNEKKYKDSPGKLKHSLQIDIAALLPGAKHSKPIIEKSVNFDIPAAERIETLESIAHKERVRIPIKRRPSTRQARHKAIRDSQILNDITDSLLTSDNQGMEQDTENEINVISSDLKIDTENEKLKITDKNKILKLEKEVLKSSTESEVLDSTNSFLTQMIVKDKESEKKNYLINTNKTEIDISVSDSEKYTQKTDSLNISKQSSTKDSKSLLFLNEDSDDDFFSFNKAIDSDIKKEKSKHFQQKINTDATKEKNVESTIKSQEINTNENIFGNEDDLFLSKPKTNFDTKQSVKTEKSKSSSIFSDEDDNDLFSVMNIKQTNQTKVVESSEKLKSSITKVEKPKISLVFSDEEEDLFGRNKSQTNSKSKSNLHDEKLSSKFSNKVSSTQILEKKSLFGNDDDDDDNDSDIFSFKIKGRTHSTTELKKPSSSKPIKPSVQVFDDPLLSNLNQDD